jgi:predicted RNA-binding protein with PUA-like domain
MSRNFWLMKTEPATFSFGDLMAKPQRTDRWEGVRNYLARNLMRDKFAAGDQVFIYHSSIAEPAVAGIAEVVGPAYPDQTALDPASPYFDPKSEIAGQSRWVCVDVKAKSRFLEAISLKRLRQEAALADMALLRPGQRLSVQPVRAEEWHYICALGFPEILD